MPFDVIQKIKRMRPHEWNSFVELTSEYDVPEIINV